MKLFLSKKALTQVQTIVIIVIIVVAAVAGVGIWYWWNTQGPKTDIKIGVYGPMSGYAAIIGTEMKDAAILFAEEVNKNGGILGRNITLVYGDTESDPAKGVAAVERLITVDGVDVLVGGFHSSVALAVMETVAEYMIPHINVASAAPSIREKIASDPEKYKSFFCVEINGSGVAVFQADFLADVADFFPTKTYVSIMEDTDVSRTLEPLQRQALEAIGWTRIFNEFLPPATTDFYSTLSKAAAENPGLIIGSGFYGSPSIAFIKQYKELGIEAPLMGSGFTITPGLIAETGEASEFLIDPASGQFTDATDEGASFTAAFKERFSRDPTYTALLQYGAMEIMADAIERANSLEKDAIVDALKETDYSGVFIGRVVFSDTNEARAGLPYRAYQTLQVQNGTLQAIWPFDYKTADFKLPS